MMKSFEALLAQRMQQKDPSQPGPSVSPSGSILGPYEPPPKPDKFDDIFKTVKFEFPKFNGENPRPWIRKCNKLFPHHMVPKSQKVYLTTLSLEGGD